MAPFPLIFLISSAPPVRPISVRPLLIEAVIILSPSSVGCYPPADILLPPGSTV